MVGASRLTPGITASSPSSDGAPAATIVAPGNLGATNTVDFAGSRQEIWLVGTLNANCTLSILNVTQGCRLRLLLQQDATGGRTLTISDGTNSTALTIPTTPNGTVEVDCVTPNSTDIWLAVLGVPGPTGPQGVQGIQGPTGPAGAGAAFQDPNGFSAVSIDFAQVDVSHTLLTNGVMQLVKVPIWQSFTATSIFVHIQTAGATLTSGQNWAGIYDSTGTRLALTADQTTNWGTAGPKAMSLTTNPTLNAGFVWVGLLANGTTPPQIFSTGALSTTNDNTSASTRRSANTGAAQTTLPASFAPAGINAVANIFGVGLS